MTALQADAGGRTVPPGGSAWAPLRHRQFAAMWGAQFVSNVGSWMRTVAAQWLMLTLTSSAVYLTLVQTAASLGLLAIAGLVTPWVLLALVFAVGTAQALTSPTWQTLQPELVAPAERQQAISLGAVNQNLARAIGPAIGGLVLAATSAGTVFLANATG